MNHLKIASILVVVLVSCQNPATTKEVDKTAVSGELAIIDLDSPSSTTSADANARVYDAHYTLLPGASFQVDGTPLVAQSSGGYYVHLSGSWDAGSSHLVSVATASGGAFRATVTKPDGLLTGLTYAPAKTDPVATAYTVSPPGGVWPAHSRVTCLYVLGGELYELDYSPTGTSPLAVPGAHYSSTSLVGATSIEFGACLENSTPMTGFRTGSAINVRGPVTNW